MFCYVNDEVDVVFEKRQCMRPKPQHRSPPPNLDISPASMYKMEVAGQQKSLPLTSQH